MSFNLSGDEGSDGDDFQLRPGILLGGDGVGYVDLLNTEIGEFLAGAFDEETVSGDDDEARARTGRQQRLEALDHGFPARQHVVDDDARLIRWIAVKKLDLHLSRRLAGFLEYNCRDTELLCIERRHSHASGVRRNDHELIFRLGGS